MNARVVQQISGAEACLETRPSPVEFELAYHAPTACDRIRFAIKSTEQCVVDSAELREANLQLLDALDRLESAERHFQDRFRVRALSPCNANVFMRNGDPLIEDRL